MLSPDEEDLEQLIKGGPFELGLYADKLGSHIFGIDSVAQVCGAHYSCLDPLIPVLTPSLLSSPPRSCLDPLWPIHVRPPYAVLNPDFWARFLQACCAVKVYNPCYPADLHGLSPLFSAKQHAAPTLPHLTVLCYRLAQDSLLLPCLGRPSPICHSSSS